MKVTKIFLIFLIILYSLIYGCSKTEFGYSDPCSIFSIGESKRSIKKKVKIYEDSGDHSVFGNCLDSIRCYLHFERKLTGEYLNGINFGFYTDEISDEEIRKVLNYYNFSEKYLEPTDINGIYKNLDGKVTLQIRLKPLFKRHFYFRVK